MTGQVKNQITKGEWVVRDVIKVDEADRRQIYFAASGMYPGKDPYLLHHYRVNFDGSGLTSLTTADANHEVSFSADMRFYVDTYSRVDMPNVSELRRTSDGSLVREIEKADISALTAAGFQAARGLHREGARREDRHLGRDRPSDELRSVEAAIRSSRTSTPGRTARSCRSRSGRSERIRRATR